MWVTVFLVAGVACAIAAWFVIRAAAGMAVAPPPPVYDEHEAYEWVVDRLPDDVAATLTPADVRRILALQVEFLARGGVTTAAVGNGGAPQPDDVVVGDLELVDYVVERARADGEEYLPEQVEPVVAVQLEYLRAIGAVGPPAGRAGA
jgi:hypothetical protein